MSCCRACSSWCAWSGLWLTIMSRRIGARRGGGVAGKCRRRVLQAAWMTMPLRLHENKVTLFSNFSYVSAALEVVFCCCCCFCVCFFVLFALFARCLRSYMCLCKRFLLPIHSLLERRIQCYDWMYCIPMACLLLYWFQLYCIPLYPWVFFSTTVTEIDVIA